MEQHSNYFTPFQDEFNRFMADLEFEETNDEAYVGAIVTRTTNSTLMGIVTKVHESGFAEVEHFDAPQMDGCVSCSDDSPAGENHLIVIRMNDEPASVRKRKRELKTNVIYNER